MCVHCFDSAVAGRDEDKSATLVVYRYVSDMYDYVMERVDTLTERELASLIRDVCVGTKSLHDNDIAHGDLKLENVLVGTKAGVAA